MNRQESREFRAMLKTLISENQGISKLQLCRMVNCESLRVCKYCSEYANPRKRAAGLAEKRHCRYSFQQIRYALTKLDDLATQRMKRPDHYQNRKWDTMTCLFIVTYEDPEQIRQAEWVALGHQAETQVNYA